jgi:3-oxoacyl-(acyl-carrier-protein) synthase
MPPPDFIAASANGTFIDEAEQAAIRTHCPAAEVYAIKAALGESVGAGSLWQTICAAQTLISGRIPPSQERARVGDADLKSAVVSTCGLNQQVAGLRLALSPLP